MQTRLSLVKQLKILKPKIWNKMNPGVNPIEFNRFEKELGLELPAYFREFYHEFNGSLTTIDFNGFKLFSLDEILKTKKNLDKIKCTKKSLWWHKSWLPFAYDSHGDLLVIDFEGTIDKAPGRILFWCKDSCNRPIIHFSFEDWLEHTIFYFNEFLSKRYNFEEMDDSFKELCEHKQVG